MRQSCVPSKPPPVSCFHLLPISLDGADHPPVAVTTAQHAGHRLADFSIRRLRIPIQKCFGCHNHAVDTKSALHRLLVDERFLNRMRLLDGSESLECRDFRSRHFSDGCDARPNRLTFNNHRAGSALTETAPKLWSTKCEIVAKHVEQRSRWIHIHRVPLTIDS